MRFTNDGERNCTFGELVYGDYFRFENGFYIKTNINNEDYDYYAVNLETGREVIMSSDIEITQIDIKEIVYEDV